MMIDLDTCKQRFETPFGRRPAGAVAAPGRVNLIGEHTDYNDGFVLPIAIERQTVALFAPREDRVVRLISASAEGPVEIDLAAPITPGEPAWANYCRGVAFGLVEGGCEVGGADIYLESDVPLGGGLSSSASLEVATALALLGGDAGNITDGELAKICQMAEHEFAGTPCGIMDQSIAIMGQAGRALLLDCRSGETRQVHFDNPDLVLLVADTKVKHELSDGGYAARRQQCYDAAGKLGVSMLRDADRAMVDAAAVVGTLTEKELMRARHVIGEIERTLDAVNALEDGDYRRFGDLMVGSHNSLRDDYEVSCEESDAIVELACECEGVYGARMTGGGFGGCAIILATAESADAVSKTVGDGFEARFDHRCPIFATHAAQGARQLF
ncbi:MAG: galactokinase [Planctomycetota bacterium]|jgi:galactokinase